MTRSTRAPFRGFLVVVALSGSSLALGCSSGGDGGNGANTSSSDASSSTATNGSNGSGGDGSGGSSTTTSGAAGSNDGGTSGSGGTDPIAVGTFQVELQPATEETDSTPAREAVTSILGRVYEYPVPEQKDWELSEEQDGCQLLVPRIPFCDPSCEGGDVCDANDTCTAFPQSYGLGTVTLTGIATESGDDVMMDPLPPSNTYQPLASAGVVYPPFAEGDEVSLQTEGGDLEAFSIQATGIAELVLTDPEDTLELVPDTPAQLAWELPDGDGSHIEVVIDISHHGGQKGEIRCSVEDNGSLTIPAELVTGLLDLGFSGFPTVLISRVALGSTQTSAGRVDLKLVNSITRDIEIPGLVSCDEADTTDQCPEGEVCQVDLKCG